MSGLQEISVMIVDDSTVVRSILKQELRTHPLIKVVGEAADPYEAKDKIKELRPNVLILDVEMPRMDGLTFLKIIMDKRPMPVIILSSLSVEGSKVSLSALSLGAFDVLAKPAGGDSTVAKVSGRLIEAILHAGTSNFSKTHEQRANTRMVQTPFKAVPLPRGEEHLLLMGASTGGTEALTKVLTNMPDCIPATCIVQHIPSTFSKAFANRLNELCPFTVKEAEDGELVEKNKVLIAPGGYHMVMADSPTGLHVRLNQDEPVFHQRPAVDVLFKSAAKIKRHHKVGVILTGMGKDGAEGLLELKNQGVYTISQHKDTCVVYGMPRAAEKLDAVYEVCHLDKIPKQIFYGFSKKYFPFSPTYKK